MMKDNIIVSVIIPVYNVEKYLDKCIQSVVKQSYNDIEIVLINDGSTDNSYEICKKYDCIDNRIILINQENGGVSRARNKGLEIAKGDYIMFVDSDDELAFDAVERLLDSAILTNADIVICGYQEVYKDKAVKVQCPTSSLIGNETIKEFVMVNLNKALASSLWAKIYKKEVASQNFHCGISMGEDLLYNLRAFSKSNRIEFVNEFLYYYNQMNVNSLVSNYKLEYYDQNKRVHLYAKKWGRKGKKDIYNTLYYMMSNSFFKYLLALSKSETKSKCKLLKDRIDKNLIEAVQNSKGNFNLLQRWILSSVNNSNVSVALLMIKAKLYNALKTVVKSN